MPFSATCVSGWLISGHQASPNKRTLSGAIELPPDQRSRFLAQQCVDEVAALDEIKLLIAADEKAEAGQFMDSPAIEIQARRFAGEDGESRISELFGS